VAAATVPLGSWYDRVDRLDEALNAPFPQSTAAIDSRPGANYLGRDPLVAATVPLDSWWDWVDWLDESLNARLPQTAVAIGVPDPGRTMCNDVLQRFSKSVDKTTANPPA
jgi:hypothetical protein